MCYIVFSGETVDDMKFWFGYDYEDMSLVNHFNQSKINENGKHTISQILGYKTSMKAICAVSTTFFSVQLFNTFQDQEETEWPRPRDIVCLPLQNGGKG